MIPGFDEGVLSMKTGGKRKLFIPSDLAYGSNGIPGVIPPNAMIVFEVELLDIK
ncbi:MAG: FKBP-type peptidyl-prolyl cis-trans isomerase [Calditrichaceae bacterium]